LVAAAGGQVKSLVEKPLDGNNILPLLHAASYEPREHVRAWYSYHGQSGEQNEHLAVTLGGWKLKVNGPRLRTLEQLTDQTNQVELFHLADDPLESSDLKDRYPEKVQQLGKLLVAHRALQPKDSVPPYRIGKDGFVPPVNWKLDPRNPNQLVGRHE
jgi:hypothetical protein